MRHTARAVVLGLSLLWGCSSDSSPSSSGDFQPSPYDDSGSFPRVSTVDLLLMIDNSSSMADKQAMLAQVVPDLVGRMIEPGCVDAATGQPVGPSVGGSCAVGKLAFAPISDLHVGVISSSLGNHGAQGVCEDAKDTRAEPHNNDQGHLISRGVGGASVPTFNGKGFLFYNPNTSGAIATKEAFVGPFAEMASGVGEHGCGYEASLESVYRFLIDPEPYATLRIDTSIGGFGQALLNGTDMALMQQRKDFLRPSSLVSVMIVTDENDCSVIDGGQGFYALLPPVTATGRSVLKPGTSKCKENPNDKCCFNCGMTQVPAGCAPAASDPACQMGELAIVDDQPNLRCFDQKRRYGADFLYPVQRYIDGFTKSKVPNRKGEMVDNPLFSDLTCNPNAGCAAMRDKSLIFVSGIVGVPWQDISVDPNDLSLGYKTAKQIADDGIWPFLVGDLLNPAGPVPPGDVHMVESITPRNGLPGPGSAPNADIKHGHEWDPSKDMSQPNADLQYACIFDLVASKKCTAPGDCDCSGVNLDQVANPLCQNAQGAYTNEQLRGKAYPGTRILQFLRGIGDRAVVASVCPAQTNDAARTDFGYRPAVDALLTRLREPLGHLTMPCGYGSSPVDPTSQQLPCAMVEVYDASSCTCDSEPGRREAREELLTPEMKAAGPCRCEIKQLSGIAQSACRVGAPNSGGADSAGWCYVDPAQFGGAAACDIVAACPVNRKHKLRFNTPSSEPRITATTFLRCNLYESVSLPPVCP